MKKFWKKSVLCSLLFLVCDNVVAAPKLVDKIVAIVNQNSILWSEYQSFKKNLAAELSRDPKTAEEVEKKEFEERVLNQMIEERLIEQEVNTLGLQATDTQLESVVDEIMKSNGLRSQKELERALKSEGLTYDEFVEQYKKRIARSNLVNQVIRPKIKISQDEIDAEIKKRDEKSEGRVSYNLAMIFVSKENASPKKLEAIQKQLKSQDKFFATANQYTDGPGKGSGGKLGWLASEDIQAPLRQELTRMKPGDISGRIDTDAGNYWIIALDQKRTNTQVDEKLREQVQEELMNSLLTKNLNQYLVDLKRKAHIEKYL